MTPLFNFRVPPASTTSCEILLIFTVARVE
ncbi:hypothetical protein CP061683_0460A, partial [Chlamydia psittaci 06-1683]